MIPVFSFFGKKIALFGLGRSGLSTAAALVAGGADVVVWDDDAFSIKQAHEQGFIAKDLRMISWEDISALVLAPGIALRYPKPHWSVALATAHNVEIIGDIELFVRERKEFLNRRNLSPGSCPFIAITGTNGKSTTTALIGHLLQKAGCDVQIGGNIGVAILSLAPFTERRFYVIECSSYQIDLTSSVNSTVGILLNLTPDHIERHGSFEYYAAIKQRLVATADKMIIGIEDMLCSRIYKFLKANGKTGLPITTRGPLKEGYFSENTTLLRAVNGQSEVLASLAGISSLRGRHNAQNTLAALACCDLLGIESAMLNASIASFKGLPHRMEAIAQKGDVLFVNDSKATNADATASALSAFFHIYWIAGGRAKEGGIHTLRTFFPRIRRAYLIGEAAADFARTIGKTTSAIISETLENAVSQAFRDASSDKTGQAVVLFSPACASFDQFSDYSVRGDTFCKLVHAL
ncbi:MAG: UDP-N-acetylmuramoylalanine--D-glutamate ligase [Candidatus Tokpelaia sp. JSC085]|nr:MAG: UDP-N-acetylmuramoylalanine--D-glutamate ligase [Candidatus Tokpelaia sp. JSC085]